jgi:hypothetical protein
MKYSKLITFFFFVIIINSCAKTPEIIHKDYNYKEIIFGIHQLELDVSLENIKYSDKTSNLISTLIYDNKSIDKYAEYLKNSDLAHAREGLFAQGFNDDGTEYFSESYSSKKYLIDYYSDFIIIIKYDYYFYSAGLAHGSYTTIYYVIDLNEEKILTINDLINKIPDDLLKQIIESNYNISGEYLRKNIFPPDTINFSNDNIELIWNIYQITPYVNGIINIEIKDEIIQKYLTEKGKMIKMLIDKNK